MASEPDASEISSIFERMVRIRDASLFLPFIFGLSNSNNTQDPERENENDENTHRERIILINPFTQGMVVIDGASSLETLFSELGNGKTGRPPASKESIDAMPSVEIKEGENDDGECVICLEEWEIGGVVKEMSCKHKFHPNCIEKWLGIHGSCPVCRYQMPVDEEDGGKKRDGDDEEEGGERRRRVGREVWVSFSVNSDRRRRSESENPNQDQAPSSDSVNADEVDG